MDRSTPLAPRPASASRTEQVQILIADTMNGAGRLFGGRLMEWIDVVAAVAARRHSCRNVTTASVDTLQFAAPAYVNDTLILSAFVTSTGRTSMEVCVRTYVENLDGTRREINCAYLVMVALDENGNPTPVPPVIPETAEEKQAFEEAKRRREIRDLRRREEF